MKKNITIIISTIKIGGGAEKVATLLANELSKKSNKYNVTLITFYKLENEQKLQTRRIDLGENISYVNKKRNPISQKLYYVQKLFTRSWKIAKLCRKNNTDVIISFMEESSFPAVVSKFFYNRAKIIVSIRNMPYRKNTLLKIMMPILYKRVHKVVTVTKTMQKYFEEKMNLKNIVTIYNPIDLDKSLQLQKEKLPVQYNHIFNNKNFVFINVGRLTEQKGQTYLIKSFKDVVKEFSHAKLVILGEGNLRNSLEKLITSLKLENHVFLLGNQSNVFPFLKASNCFILSSLWEGFPNVLIEAMSVNLPVISTDCKTGPREILAPDLNINMDIKYPYYSKKGTLIKPLNVNINSSQQGNAPQKDLLLAMYNVIINKHNKHIFEEKEFNTISIIKKWELVL